MIQNITIDDTYTLQIQVPITEGKTRGHAISYAIENSSYYFTIRSKSGQAYDFDSIEHYFKKAVGDQEPERDKLWDAYHTKLKSIQNSKRVLLLSIIKCVLLISLIAGVGKLLHYIWEEHVCTYVDAYERWCEASTQDFYGITNWSWVSDKLEIVNALLLIAFSIGAVLIGLEFICTALMVFFGAPIVDRYIDKMLSALLFRKEIEALKQIDFVGDDMFKFIADSDAASLDPNQHKAREIISHEKQAFMKRLNETLLDNDEVSLSL